MSDTAEARLARLEQEMVGQGREIREIKARLDRSDELLTAIHRLTVQNDNMLKEIKEHDERLKAVESRPGKRWDAVVGAAIGALVASAVAWLAGR